MGKRVLLADDSATIQKLVKMALAGTSYELQSAFDGREALKLVDSAAPDIVLADAIMPDMDGYELCRAVKDDPRLVGVPVVLLIGRFQPFDEQRAEEAGIDERMIKPFSADNLIALIEKLLAESANKRIAVPEEPENGDLDATVNMSAEELAAHTSHWQQEQTAMTEDIPKIEDIEFDEDVQFDDDPITSDLGEADTMMLEEALDDSADLDGPMTMELSTEDLADIDEPVTSFDEITNSIDPEEQLLGDDDDLEELDESDLLDDSIADFEDDFDSSSDESAVPLEDQDTGPLHQIKQVLPSYEPEPEDEDDDTSDTQPHGTPTFEEPSNDVLVADEVLPINDGSIGNNVSADVDFSAEASTTDSDSPTEIASEMSVNEVTPDASSEEEDFEDSDKTVAVNTEWLAANLVQEKQPEESAEEPPLEVDDELPLEESAVEQDALLDDADYEPLSSAIEEPLADALLVEEAPTVSVEMESDVLEPSDEVEELQGMPEATPETFVADDVSTEEIRLDVPPMAMPAPGVSLSDSMDEVTEEAFRSEMPTQEVPAPDFGDDEDLLEAESAEEEIASEMDSNFATEDDDVASELASSEASDDEETAPAIAATHEISNEVPDTPAASHAPVGDADVSALSEHQLDKLADMVAERVMRKFERDTLREIAWEVIPELSEAMIKKRIFELEREADKS